MIWLEDFEDRISMIPPFYRKRMASRKGKLELLNRMIQEELFYFDAVDKGLTEDEEILSQMKNIERSILAEKYRKNKMGEIQGDGAKEEAFDQMKRNLKQKYKVVVHKELLVPATLEKSNAVLVSYGDEVITMAELVTRFEKIPDRFQNRIADQKGRLDYVERMVADRLFALEAMSEGYHEQDEFKDQMKKIAKSILTMRLKKDLKEREIAYEDHVALLKKKYPVVIYDQHLKDEK